MNGIHENQMFASAPSAKVYTGTEKKSRNDMETRVSYFKKNMIEQVKCYREDFPEWLLVNVDDPLIDMYEQGAERLLLDKCRADIYSVAAETIKTYPVAITVIANYKKDVPLTGEL